MTYCKNCGKIINPKTLICDACGTDYNEKPRCEHLCDKVGISFDMLEFRGTLSFKCQKCGELLKIPATYELIKYMERCL